MDSPISTNYLELTDEGFILHTDALDPQEVQWALVREVVAYRRDPDGLDLVCLGFRVSAFNEYVEINEEMENYGQVLECMYEKCQGISHHWWHEIAGVYGTNRMTIYGLPASEQHKPSAAELYLMRTNKPKIPTGRELKKILFRGLGLAAVAFIQVLLSWVITLPDAAWANTTSMIAFPILMTVLAARLWPNPKIFFMLLGGFYIFEFSFAQVLDFRVPTLIGELTKSNLTWLLLIGGEILAAMFVMLLPDKHATGRPIR